MIFNLKLNKEKKRSNLDPRTLVYWWEPKDNNPNAGDHLSKVIVNQMLTLADKEILEKKDTHNKLLAIGSVMHFAKDGDCIWGTGVNGKIDYSQLKFNKLDVRAVRGPLTRDILLKKNIHVPEVYGDPGLLISLFFQKKLLTNNTNSKNSIIIPHMNEDMGIYSKYHAELCSPRQGALAFTKKIVESKFVISSSLHGVIIAESYGIPAILLQNSSGESRFKYDDYYFGTGRFSYPIANTIEEAYDLEPPPPVNLQSISNGLLSSFPYDLW